MSLIIATGSNVGNSLWSLKTAKEQLKKHFDFVAESRIYRSAPVDYLDQPDFFNQVLEFKIPHQTPELVLTILRSIETDLGRERKIERGPRTLDLDLIFWGTKQINTEQLTVPHPRWLERSFVIRPLQELPFFQTVEKCFTIPTSFEVDAFPI